MDRSDDDLLRATLAAVAPGTDLRDGLERILRGRTGALIVLGQDRVVDSMASSVADRALPRGTIAMGEVGLAGEIRPVTGVPRRLAEAARLGFARAVVPGGSLGGGPTPEGMQVVEVTDIRSAVRLMTQPV